MRDVFSHLELEITHLDPSRILEELPPDMLGAFDVVYISHTLEYLDRLKVISAFRNAIAAVRNLGEVWTVVPSMEWAANEIINRREGIHVQANLFGTQVGDAFHRCGFTLEGLRQLVEVCGLIPRKAYQSPYNIQVEETVFGSLLNVVIAIRVNQEEDPAEAIDG